MMRHTRLTYVVRLVNSDRYLRITPQGTRTLTNDLSLATEFHDYAQAQTERDAFWQEAGDRCGSSHSPLRWWFDVLGGLLVAQPVNVTLEIQR